MLESGLGRKIKYARRIYIRKEEIKEISCRGGEDERINPEREGSMGGREGQSLSREFPSWRYR